MLLNKYQLMVIIINKMIFSIIYLFFTENWDKISKELQTLKKLKNDFIIQYINDWTENNKLYIQMELCSHNLKQIIALKNDCFDMNINNPIINSIDYYI